MKNNQRTKFFSQDIFVINPYSSSQNIISKDSTPQYYIDNNKTKSENIILDKKIYSSRERVALELNVSRNGNYSISVKLLDSLPHPPITTIDHFMDNRKDENLSKPELIYLPEIRGKALVWTSRIYR